MFIDQSVKSSLSIIHWITCFILVIHTCFENIQAGRRLMRVQTSNATIHGNTIVDSYGSIALEDGKNNIVSNNIIIRTVNDDNGGSSNATKDDEVSGIAAHRFGHTITGNYIAGLHGDDSGLGGIVFSVRQLAADDGGVPDEGFASLLADNTSDFTMTVSNNTILNTVQPIVFSKSWEGNGDDAIRDEISTFSATDQDYVYNSFVINFDNNLIMNGLNNDVSKEGQYVRAHDDGADIQTSSNHAFEYDSDLINHADSSFNFNYAFTDSFSSGDDENDFWVDITSDDYTNRAGNEGDANRGVDQDGGSDAAYVTGNDCLIEADPAGAQAGAGTDVDNLHYIEESQVGTGSTWTADE